MNRFLRNSKIGVAFSLLSESDGDLWICGTDRGVYYYEARTDTLFDFTPNLTALIPNSARIVYLFVDRTETAWIMTTLGLVKLTLPETAFEQYFTEPAAVCNGNCSFRGMTEDNQGGIYASFYGGITWFDPKRKNARTTFSPERNSTFLPSGLYLDLHGLWLNNGSLMDIKTGMIRAVPGASAQSSEEGLFTRQKNGCLWRVYYQDLSYLGQLDGQLQWKKALELPDKNEYANDALYTSPYSDNIFISHRGILIQYTPGTQKQIRYDPKNWGLPVSRILAIEEVRKGSLWLATDIGLVRLDLVTGLARHYSEENGLVNNFVCGMLAEGDSCLWLSTNHGLSRFHIASGSFVNFFEEDGLSHNEFNRKSYLKARDGRMFFGGLRGINAFYPQKLMDSWRRRNDAAQMVLASFEFVDEDRDTTIRIHDFAGRPEIHLYYQYQSFTFEYALTDFRNPQEISYSYKMDGFEDHWSAPSKFNFIRFSRLPSGRYVFRVKARDSRGRWHPHELAINVIVHPPWWATWWAWLWYALLAGSVAYGVFSFYRRRWNLQNELKLEQAEALRLKELDAFKTRLYTNLTHEFRIPLTVILGMAGQIRSEPQKYLDEGTRLIETNGKNLLHLINQLLDLSKLENNAFQLHLQRGDIVPYLRYVTESFQTYANHKNLSLRFFTTLESMEMDYDPEQIKQVLTNLISNAVKFTPSGGEVSVRVKEQQAQLFVEVKDTGIGISKENLPYIFDRFYQVDGSHTREGEGTGIGLAHTLELVKAMGGDIGVESEVGKGSTFLVRLQVTKNAPASDRVTLSRPVEGLPNIENLVNPPERYHSSLGSHHRKLPQLLIIEDNPDVVVYLKSCLKELYRIDVAFNGNIGIEKALENIPDLIISDVMMPEKDGYQVCDTLKNDERTSHIPIVLLTAKADAASKIAGLRRGADAYITKPFDKEEMLVRLEMLVERQKRMVAYFSKNLHAGNAQGETEEAIRVEDAFMQKVRQIVEAHHGDEDFALPQLCQKIGLSRSQLFRKMQALSGTTPSDFIRSYRLNKAKTLLETTDLTVSEVAWQVGFKDLGHFSRSFQEAFGMPPSATGK
ncbi:MAG: helix-turn-helix domain-containing protein [Saprospiraceae bacterium]|nr:helix-turn-helix domain-containing protein [Saprospiraceae bacterium]